MREEKDHTPARGLLVERGSDGGVFFATFEHHTLLDPRPTKTLSTPHLLLLQSITWMFLLSMTYNLDRFRQREEGEGWGNGFEDGKCSLQDVLATELLLRLAHDLQELLKSDAAIAGNISLVDNLVDISLYDCDRQADQLASPVHGRVEGISIHVSCQLQWIKCRRVPQRGNCCQSVGGQYGAQRQRRGQNHPC